MINVYKAHLIQKHSSLSPNQISEKMREALPVFTKIYADIMGRCFKENKTFPSESEAFAYLSSHFSEGCQQKSESKDPSFTYIEQNEVYPFLGKFVEYLSKKSNTLKLNENSNWDNIPKNYSKDEVISRLSLYPDESESIKKIRAMPHDFIKLEDLDESLRKKIEPVCTPYISTMEVLKRVDNEGADNFYKLLQLDNTSKTDRNQLIGKEQLDSKPGRVLKYGVEGQRELLVETLNTSLSLNPYLVPKTASNLTSLKLRGGETIEKEGGIVGSWVNGTLLSSENQNMNMRALSEKKMHYEAALFQNDSQKIESTKKAFEAEKQKYLNAHDPSSVQENGRLSLILMSGDGHMGQYTLEEGSGTVFCFDEGRNLYPNDVFSETVKENGKEVQKHYPLLRAGLLDHPACDEPLDKALQEKILSQDIDEMMESVSHLQGKDFDDKLPAYKQALQTIPFLNFLIQNPHQIRNREQDLKQMAAFLNISISSPPNKTDCETLHNLMSDFVKKTQIDFLSHLHPKAFEGLKKRLITEKKYVESCIEKGIEPTIKGLREALYPNFTPFFKFLERTEPLSGMFFGLQKKDGQTSRRSLESILERAKKEGAATTEEIEAMENALKEIKKECGDTSILHFCEAN